MFPKKTAYMGILLVATCAALAHCALEPSMATDVFGDNPADKNDDAITLHKRPSFFVGSRYGRSGGNLQYYAPSKTRRLNVVPRNDRFFLGSRYGKRSNEYASPYEQDNNNINAAAARAPTQSNGNNNAGYMMSCMYTGVRNLYRCSSIDEINNIINQLTIAHNIEADDDDDIAAAAAAAVAAAKK